MATAVGNTARPPSSPIEVFYSYSHKDEELREELVKHLSILRRQGFIRGWHDREITAGSEWAGEIDQHLNSARIILLLISSDFVDSDYCYDLEMGRAMQRHEAGEARVIPVILRSVDWSGAPFGKIQGLPKDGKPVTSWPNRDEAFQSVAVGIRRAVEAMAEADSIADSIDERQLPGNKETSFDKPGKHSGETRPNRWPTIAWKPWIVALTILVVVGAVAWRGRRGSGAPPGPSLQPSSAHDDGSATENPKEQSPQSPPSESSQQPQEQNQKPQEAAPKPKMRVLHSAASARTDLAFNPRPHIGPGHAALPPSLGKAIPLQMGGVASVRSNGQIRSIQANGLSIEHGLRGERTVESTRGDERIVSSGKNAGYVQRTYAKRGGRSYYARTYYVHGRYRTGVYRAYSYHGRAYYGYVPAYNYHPAFYSWAYDPWPAPVSYGWDWGGAPWYGYFGNYFTPFPSYPGAPFWLTDYLLAANLEGAYALNGQAASATDDAGDSGGNSSASDSGQTELTPEVKHAIAEEVKTQLAMERESAQGASSGGQTGPASSMEMPPALDPALRTFVVSTDLTVLGDGKECELTPGDVITRLTDTPDPDGKVSASVASSKKADCATGKQVMVSVDDLQEMYNHFQEEIDEGLKSLAAKQGTAGLPRAPDTATLYSDVPPPPPESGAAKLLENQQKAADEIETRVKQELPKEAPKK